MYQITLDENLKITRLVVFLHVTLLTVVLIKLISPFTRVQCVRNDLVLVYQRKYKFGSSRVLDVTNCG